MRIHTSAALTDLRTVKRQGAYIAEAWRRQTGIDVNVVAIKPVSYTHLTLPTKRIV